MFLRRINGSSMSPTLEDGDIVLAYRRRPRVGQAVVVSHGELEVVKRVSEVRNGRFYVLGDNPSESTDSRHYGYVTNRDILGTIMMVLPRSVAPPQLAKPIGLWFGRLAAVILVVMALLHLYRIDTFIPIFDTALPSGPGFATTMALIVIVSEIFAIPFALRMRLSPLAHLVSGALIVFAPLWWVAICVMTVGLADNVGQFGEFYGLASTPLLLGLNILWTLFSFLTLYMLGYNDLKFRRVLRK